VFLVAADPVQCLRQNHIETSLASIRHQRLEAGAIGRCPAQRMVGINLNDRPPFPLRACPANPHLIVDRGLRLVVGGVTGMDSDAHRATLQKIFACRDRRVAGMAKISPLRKRLAFKGHVPFWRSA
jgi:hypothetical protein